MNKAFFQYPSRLDSPISLDRETVIRAAWADLEPHIWARQVSWPYDRSRRIEVDPRATTDAPRDDELLVPVVMEAIIHPLPGSPPRIIWKIFAEWQGLRMLVGTVNG